MTLNVDTALTLHSLLTAELTHLNETAPTDRPLNEEEIDERIVLMHQIADVSKVVLVDGLKTQMSRL